nr:hypothetical protein [Allomuricauda sp.]
MKNTNAIAALLFGCTFFLFISCQQKVKKDEQPSEEPEVDTQEMVEAPEDIISLKESKQLYDNYTKSRVAAIMSYERETNEDPDFEVARYVDFDYKAMKQYIAFVEQEAKKAKVNVSTFRLYFANYPNEERFPDGKKVIHPRQNSIFVVPTLHRNEQNYGFYIGADGSAQLIRDAIHGKAQGMGDAGKNSEKSYASFAPSLPAAIQGEQSLSFNHGQSGPPPPGDF